MTCRHLNGHWGRVADFDPETRLQCHAAVREALRVVCRKVSAGRGSESLSGPCFCQWLPSAGATAQAHPYHPDARHPKLSLDSSRFALVLSSKRWLPEAGVNLIADGSESNGVQMQLQEGSCRGSHEHLLRIMTPNQKHSQAPDNYSADQNL